MRALLIAALLVIPLGVEVSPLDDPDIRSAVSQALNPETRWTPLPPTPPELSAPFSTNVRISDDPGTGNQNEVSMVVDTAGRMVAAWNDQRGASDFRCGRAYSLDRGQTWSSNVLYGNLTYDASADPVLAADDVGNIYHICMSFNRPFGTGSTMEVLWTADGGVTWSAPVDLGMPSGNDKPWIAAHGNGTVFAGWSHYVSDIPRIVFRTSTDWGQNWSAPLYIGAAASAYLGMDVDDAGFVHTVFFENGNMVYRRSEDLGVSFTSQVIISPAGADCFACAPRSGTLPALAASWDGQDLYAVWSGNFSAATGEDIRLAYSHNGGASWNTVTVNDDGASLARQFMPFVDVDWEGRVHVMWSDLRSGNHEVYYVNSSDGGATFGSSTPVTDTSASTVGFQGDYQVILVDAFGVAHLAWCDTRNGHGDIFYATARVANETLTIVVSPSSSQITADETVQFTAEGYNATGGPVSISPTWEATGGSINATGHYVPSPAGSFRIYANDSNASGFASVEVLAGALNSIAVAPASVTLSADETQQFAADGLDAKANSVAIAPTWETTGGSIDATGLYTPAPAGTFRVYANQSGFSGVAVVTVTAGSLASLAVAPPTATLTADETLQFSAAGQDAHGNPVSPSVEWSATNGSVSGAGLFTPWSAGQWTITARQGSVEAQATVTVLPGAVARLAITPLNVSLQVGESVTFEVQAWDAKGNAVEDPEVEWTVAGGLGTVDAAGTFVADQSGSGTVSASVGDVSVSAEVEVVAEGLLASLQDIRVYLIVAGVLGLLIVIVLVRRRGGRKGKRD